jgi:hypothetical protein
MKTGLLTQTTRIKNALTGYRGRKFKIGWMEFYLYVSTRGAGGRAFELVWFPTHKLTCAYSVRTFTGDPTKRHSEHLRPLLAECLKRENAHYLVDGTPSIFRKLAA